MKNCEQDIKTDLSRFTQSVKNGVEQGTITEQVGEKAIRGVKNTIRDELVKVHDELSNLQEKIDNKK